MKKRILSMLLLAVMIVTALPLAVLSVSAAEEEVVLTEEDYTALYVQNGLVSMYDFFRLNSYWGGSATLPVAPIFSDKYATADSRLSGTGGWIVVRRSHTYNGTYEGFTQSYSASTESWVNLRVPDGGQVVYATEAEAKAALAALDAAMKPAGYDYFVARNPMLDATYQKDVNAYRSQAASVLLGFRTFGSSELYINMPVVSALDYHDQDGAAQRIPFKFGPGYLQMDYHHGQSYLTYSAPSAKDGDVTVEITMTSGDGVYPTAPEQEHASYFIFGDVSLVKSAAGVYTSFRSYNGTGSRNFDDFTLAGDEYTPHKFALFLNRTRDGSSSIVTSRLVVDNEEKVAAGTAKDTTPDNVASILGFSSAANQRIYSIRVYSRQLTDAERAQNHFADLLKWYKIDPLVYTKLDDVVKADIAAEFASYEIGGDAAVRAEIEEKYVGIVNEVVYGELLVGDDSEACAAFHEVAMALSLDISGILVLNNGLRAQVYEVVNALPTAQKTNRAMVQGAVDNTINAILKAQYGPYLPQEVISYKDIYVKQDQLVTWVDLFAARPSDGNLYMDWSYPEETYNLRHWKEGTSSTWNPLKKRVKQESGEQHFRDTYVFRDSDDQNFSFGDIPDANWGHTNIRTYGDGRLICGKNNVLKLHTPNSQGSLTYEFVMAIQGAGSPNFQLDAFRLYTSANASQVKVSSISYYGYGGDVSQKEGALLNASPSNSYVKYTNSFNLAITIDRTVGNDTGHYYIKEYRTDANGNTLYSFPRTEITKLVRTSGNDYISRQEIDGAWYYTCTSKEYGTVVVFTENESGKPEYITVTEEGTQYLAFYAVVNGSVDETPIMYENAAGTREAYTGNGKVATTVKGPYLVNPPREVEQGTEGASPKISYAGMQTIGVHINGQRTAEVAGIPYTPGDIGWVGNGSDPTFFAVRAYACVLTQEELDQNHFADLAGYAGFDLSKYMLLSDAQRKTLHTAFAAYEVGGNRAAAIEAYEEQVSAMAYDFGSNSDAAKHFVEVCRAFALDTTALYPLSQVSRERVFQAFADVDPTASYLIPVLQKQLADAIAEELSAHYAAALGHSAIAFEGWQVRLTGALGLRALFSTNLVTVAELEARGIKVKTGVLTACADDADLDDLRAVISPSGEITLEEGGDITMAKGYWTGEETGAVIDGDIAYYTVDTLIPDDEPDFDERAFFYLGYVIVTDEAGETTVFFEETTTMNGRRSGDEMSLLALSETARDDYGIVYPNIQRVLNSVEEEVAYVSALVGGKGLFDYKLVSTGDPAALNAFQEMLAEKTAVRMQTILSSESAKYTEGLVYLGVADNVYGNGYYGISTVAGNIYLWHNSGAKIDDVLAFFSEILDSFAKDGKDIQLLDNHDYVRRVQ